MDPEVQRIANKVMRNILNTLQDMQVLTQFMIGMVIYFSILHQNDRVDDITLMKGHITQNRVLKVNE